MQPYQGIKVAGSEGLLWGIEKGVAGVVLEPLAGPYPSHIHITVALRLTQETYAKF
jgi:hypothetical protein